MCEQNQLFFVRYDWTYEVFFLQTGCIEYIGSKLPEILESNVFTGRPRVSEKRSCFEVPLHCQCTVKCAFIDQWLTTVQFRKADAIVWIKRPQILRVFPFTALIRISFCIIVYIIAIIQWNNPCQNGIISWMLESVICRLNIIKTYIDVFYS